MKLHERSSHLRCIYCHGDGELSWRCGCGAVLHSDCREELGGCSSLGCSPRPPRVPYQLYSEWVRLTGAGAWYRERLLVDEEQDRLDEQRRVDERWNNFFAVSTVNLAVSLFVVGIILILVRS